MELTLIVDTREKITSSRTRIENAFDNVVHKKLDYGDYSFIADGTSYEYKFVVERKASLDELAKNLSCKDRSRFFKEIKGAQMNGIKLVIVVENATYEDILNKNYRSKMTVQSFSGSLNALQKYFGSDIVFCGNEDISRVITQLFRKEMA